MSEGVFQIARLANAYQALRGSCASGCISQNDLIVERATIRITNFATKLVATQVVAFEIYSQACEINNEVAVTTPFAQAPASKARTSCSIGSAP